MVQKVAEDCELAPGLAHLTTGKFSVNPAVNGYLFRSPEHEVLMVSYCDQSMSIVRRQQFVLKANSS